MIICLARRLAGALLALVALVLVANPGAAQLAVAGEDFDAGVARLRALRTRPPWSPRPAVVSTGAEAVLSRAGRGRLVSLSRGDGTVTVVSTAGWRIRRSFDLGAASGLEDIAVAGPCTAFLTRRRATHLLRLDLCSGATAEVVDLSPFADPDGIPDLGAMIVHEGRLFVQIRRANQDTVRRFVAPPYLAVVDLASETLIDVDAALPGVQAIALSGTAPKHRMQVVEATRRLYVSATGGVMDEGGLEAIDLDTLRSAGLVIREVDGKVGADLGPFVFVTPEAGYLTFTTDFDLSSHLTRFTLTGGVEFGQLHVSVGYAVPALAADPVTDTLFLPDGEFDRQGVHVFRASTGERLTAKDEPIATGGRPSDVLLLRPPGP